MELLSIIRISKNKHIYTMKKTLSIFGLILCTSLFSQDIPFNKLYGNGDPVHYYLGHYPVANSDGLDINWYGGIKLQTSAGVGIQLLNNGNVGIGTADPKAPLDVKGRILINPELPVWGVGIKGYDTYWSRGYNFMSSDGTVNLGGFSAVGPKDKIDRLFVGKAWDDTIADFYPLDKKTVFNGNVGIGTSNIENSEGWNKVLQIRGDIHSKILASSSNVIAGLWAHNYGYYGAPAGGITGTYTNHPFSFITNGSNKMTIFSSGKITIGTAQPDNDPNFLLYVKKGIKSEQVKIEIASANGWADYVFNKNYKLLSLSEVEKHIEEKGHLPNIPSAEEVVRNGVNLGEMDAKLLEKIEELTLYLIQLNKDVKQLKEENKELKKTMNSKK